MIKYEKFYDLVVRKISSFIFYQNRDKNMNCFYPAYGNHYGLLASFVFIMYQILNDIFFLHKLKFTVENRVESFIGKRFPLSSLT